MDIKHQSLVLDINETRNYTFIKACQGDQKSRYIDCTLTQNGSVLRLTSNYRAIVKASINNEVKAINSCTIDTTSQVIVVELTSIMLDTPGILNCEITVQDGQQIVTSQAFAVQVRQSTVANETEIKKSKEYGALVDALSYIADVESKADKVQALVDSIDKLESADRLKHLAEHGRFNFSATFTSDGVIKKTTSASILQSGDFATGQNDIGTAYVSNAVTKIDSGTFINCTSLTTIYVDNTVGNVEIVSGAIPDGVSIVYSNDDNFINVNELLASAIKSLKSSVNTNRTDWESRATSIEAQHKTDVTELSQTIQKVKESALEEFASVKADLDKKENVSNKVNTIDFPSTNYYPSTKAVWDYVTSKLSSLINDIATLNNNKVNVTDYNIFKDDIKATVDNNTNAIKTNATDIATNSKLINQNAIKVTTDKSTSIVLNDSSDSNIVGLTLYGKSTQSEVPMPNSPIGIQDTLNPTITVTNDIDTQSIQLNYSLRSVGDICDKIIVNENGDGYIERNVGVINLKSIPKEQWMKSGRKVDRYYAPLTVSYNIQNYSKLLCTHFEKKSDNDGEVLGKITANATNIGFTFAEKDTTTMEDWVSFINNNDVLLYYILSTPTVTQLTQEQVNNILSMYTNYPNTCALSNCDFQLTYVADTKHYIDNKFNELATALVAHESEVM